LEDDQDGIPCLKPTNDFGFTFKSAIEWYWRQTSDVKWQNERTAWVKEHLKRKRKAPLLVDLSGDTDDESNPDPSKEAAVTLAGFQTMTSIDELLRGKRRKWVCRFCNKTDEAVAKALHTAVGFDWMQPCPSSFTNLTRAIRTHAYNEQHKPHWNFTTSKGVCVSKVTEEVSHAQAAWEYFLVVTSSNYDFQNFQTAIEGAPTPEDLKSKLQIYVAKRIGGALSWTERGGVPAFKEKMKKAKISTGQVDQGGDFKAEIVRNIDAIGDAVLTGIATNYKELYALTPPEIFTLIQDVFVGSVRTTSLVYIPKGGPANLSSPFTVRRTTKMPFDY
jgi:hypothetical protein